jgi:hypothetical protein
LKRNFDFLLTGGGLSNPMVTGSWLNLNVKEV